VCGEDDMVKKALEKAIDEGLQNAKNVAYNSLKIHLKRSPGAFQCPVKRGKFFSALKTRYISACNMEIRFAGQDVWELYVTGNHATKDTLFEYLDRKMQCPSYGSVIISTRHAAEKAVWDFLDMKKDIGI
jgi:hypothetical protein